MTDRNHDLATRMDRLERENRRLRRIGLASLAGVGALTLMSFAAPSLCHTVWAERFVLQDAQDQKRFVFNAYGTDTPTMTFNDDRGQALASIGVAKDGTFHLKVNEEGRMVPATLRMDESGALKIAGITQAHSAKQPKAASKKDGSVN